MWEIFDRKIGLMVSDVVNFLDTVHPVEKGSVLNLLCAYVFVNTVTKRLFHHQYLDPSNLRNKLYKKGDLRKYFNEVWEMITCKAFFNQHVIWTVQIVNYVQFLQKHLLFYSFLNVCCVIFWSTEWCWLNVDQILKNVDLT